MYFATSDLRLVLWSRVTYVQICHKMHLYSRYKKSQQFGKLASKTTWDIIFYNLDIMLRSLNLILCKWGLDIFSEKINK